MFFCVCVYMFCISIQKERRRTRRLSRLLGATEMNLDRVARKNGGTRMMRGTPPPPSLTTMCCTYEGGAYHRTPHWAGFQRSIYLLLSTKARVKVNLHSFFAIFGCVSSRAVRKRAAVSHVIDVVRSSTGASPTTYWHRACCVLFEFS